MALSNAHDLGTGISYLDNNQIIAVDVRFRPKADIRK